MARLAASVALGLSEATRRWPNRRTVSDGALGDRAHRARPSDHNPDSRGVVHAFDLTNDPGHGVDCNALAELIRFRRDPRVKYVIWNRRIYYGPHDEDVQAGRVRPWEWHRYDGENPHTLHMHVSVGHTTTAENDRSPWYQPKEELSVADVQTILAELEEIKQALAVEGSTGPADTIEKLYWNVVGIKQALAIEGTTGPDDSIERLYQRAKNADVKATSADLKADQALVGISEIRGLVEQILLRVGGSE